MNRKKNFLVSSTPHPNRTNHVFSLFEDLQFSPITEPMQLKFPAEPQPLPLSSKPNGVRQTGALRKRKVGSKVKAAPESVTAEVLKELGVEAQDTCNNALSHSRNLYNMFPEPIILDSDEENSIIAKKPAKKPKQDSKVIQSSTVKNQEEKKTKERVPGSSRTTRLTRLAADRKPKKQYSIQSLNTVSASSKDLKTTAKTKRQTKSKLPDNHQSTPSVILLNDDDDDSSFPVYQPGTSIYRTTSINKIKEKPRLSVELDEKFPIEWSGRRKKTADNKTEKVSDVENNKVQESKDLETNNNKKEIIKPIKGTKHRTLGVAEVFNGFEPKCSGDDIAGKDCHVVNGKNPKPVLISRFEDVRFKLSNTCGGIIAKCLKSDKNDVGFLEVPANEVFKGQRAKVTFVVIEGKAKVLHLGTQQTLLPGDMIHISDGSGYKFESAEKDDVRFLYIKEH